MNKKRVIAILAIVVIILLSATALLMLRHEDIDDGIEEHIKGTVTVSEADRIFVESVLEPGETVKFDKASIRIASSTKIYKKVKNKLEETSMKDIKVGTLVSVLFEDAVSMSLPVQALAKVIVII